MLFTKLRLNYFGRFHNKEIELKPGINLIYGDNEAGKSTIHTFIRGMLFGIERLRGRGAASREDVYTRYLPWDYPGAYSGSMDLRSGDKEYRLQRSFHATDKNFSVTDLTTGREMKLKEGQISELFPGLTESAFKNTISIEQLKAQTDAELAAQVRNYITNLSIAKSKEVDVGKAVSLLNEQKKQLDPSRNLADLQTLQAEIADGLEKEERMDQLTLQLKELLHKENQLKEQKEAAKASISSEEAARMEQLPAILEKFRSCQELSKRLDIIKQQDKELQARISFGEKEQHSIEQLKQDIREAQKLRTSLTEFDKQELELKQKADHYKNYALKNLLVTLVPLIFVAVLILLFTGFIPAGFILSGALGIAGITAYLYVMRKSIGRQREVLNKETELNQRKAEVSSALENILMRYQVSQVEELTEKQEEALKNYYELDHARQQQKECEQQIRILEDNKDQLYDTIMKYTQYYTPEEELSIASMQKLQEAIRQKKQEISGRLTEITSQHDSCRLRIEKLKWEISALEQNEEKLLKNQEQLSAMLQAKKDNDVELDAVKLALSTIQELAADIHDSFGQQLNKAVSEVISSVTGGKYNDLKIDEKLDVKVGWNGGYVPLDRLSAGTMDQVYFALRLAVADLLLGQEEVPLLLDDSFALYDESRVKAALSGVAARKQILLFTCHKREQALLKELGLPCNQIDLTC